MTDSAELLHLILHHGITTTTVPTQQSEGKCTFLDTVLDCRVRARDLHARNHSHLSRLEGGHARGNCCPGRGCRTRWHPGPALETQDRSSGKQHMSNCVYKCKGGRGGKGALAVQFACSHARTSHVSRITAPGWPIICKGCKTSVLRTPYCNYTRKDPDLIPGSSSTLRLTAVFCQG